MSFLSHGNKNTKENQFKKTSEQCNFDEKNQSSSSFLIPASSIHIKYNNDPNNIYFKEKNINANVNLTKIADCLSNNSKNLPPASELLSQSNSYNGIKMLSDSKQYTQLTNVPGSGGILPSISFLGQKPATPMFQAQQQSPSIPPSPYINTPSTYCSLTEPGTPATQIFNQIDYTTQALSPSISNPFHSSNPPSIMSSIPPSPASLSNIPKSPSVKNICVTTTPECSNQQGDYYLYGQITSNNNESYMAGSSQYITIPQTNTQHQQKLTLTSPLSVTESVKSSRTYKYSNYQSNRRSKNTPFSSMLKIRTSTMGSSYMYPDDGPTVKEHLQQLHARNKMQQDILNKKLRPGEERRGRKSKISSTTAITPQKSFLEPYSYNQYQQEPFSTANSTNVVENYQYENATSNKKYLMSSQPVNFQTTTSINKDSNFDYNINNRVIVKNQYYLPNENVVNKKTNSQQDVYNDRFELTVASVASGASENVESEDFLESSIDLNSLSPSSDPFSNIEYYDGKSAGNNSKERKQKGNSPSNFNLIVSTKGAKNKRLKNASVKNRQIFTFSNPSIKQTSSIRVQNNCNTAETHLSSASSGTNYSKINSPLSQNFTKINSTLYSPNTSISQTYQDSVYLQQPKQQCTRIHVQNPPNAMGCNFPLTETKIHVVQQPKYQDVLRTQELDAKYGNNQYKNIDEQQNSSIISVHQHPSVALIQQQQNGIETDRVHHIIVQQNSNSFHDENALLQNSNIAKTYEPSSYVLGNKDKSISNCNVFVATQKLPNSPPYQLITNSPHKNKLTLPIYQSNTLNKPFEVTNLSEDVTEDVHQKDLEYRKYSIKLYHLQRTIRALVYKNGALSDELARLNQRIQTVTEERKMLSKRLQHHERNRIRRIQAQKRKATAAATARKVVSDMVTHENYENVQTNHDINVKVELNESSSKKSIIKILASIPSIDSNYCPINSLLTNEKNDIKKIKLIKNESSFFSIEAPFYASCSKESAVISLFEQKDACKLEINNFETNNKQNYIITNNEKFKDNESDTSMLNLTFESTNLNSIDLVENDSTKKSWDSNTENSLLQSVDALNNRSTRQSVRQQQLQQEKLDKERQIELTNSSLQIVPPKQCLATGFQKINKLKFSPTSKKPNIVSPKSINIDTESLANASSFSPRTRSSSRNTNRSLNNSNDTPRNSQTLAAKRRAVRQRASIYLSANAEENNQKIGKTNENLITYADLNQQNDNLLTQINISNLQQQNNENEINENNKQSDDLSTSQKRRHSGLTNSPKINNCTVITRRQSTNLNNVSDSKL